MAIPRVKRIAHIVLFVRDPRASAEWYGDVLGMRVSATVPDGPYRGGIFLSFGEHDHDLALFPASSAADRGKEFEHIGLEVDCDGNIDQLRRLYGKMLQRGVRINEVLDHGVSIGIYFFDPDGHQLEVFCQLVAPANGAAIAELGRNEGQANPIALEPMYD
jgi:catechol 2,3-dioxygenase